MTTTTTGSKYEEANMYVIIPGTVGVIISSSTEHCGLVNSLASRLFIQHLKQTTDKIHATNSKDVSIIIPH